MTSSIRIPQVFLKLVGKKTQATLKFYRGMLKYTIKYALYLTYYDSYFHINDDAKKCTVGIWRHKNIFFYNSFIFLPHEVLQEVCFGIDTLIIKAFKALEAWASQGIIN